MFQGHSRLVMLKSQDIWLTAEAKQASDFVKSMLPHATSLAYLKFGDNVCLVPKMNAL